MSKKIRINWIDIYRGILIILVVIGHVVSSYHAVNRYNNAFYNILFQLIYSFHMGAFMFISGYCFKFNDKASIKKQIFNKAITYIIPYIFFSFFWVIFKVLLSKYTNTDITFVDLIAIPICPISFMWFIYALFLMTIVQIFLDYRKINKKFILIFSVILYVVNSLLKNNIKWYSSLIVCDFFSFWLYYLIGQYYGKLIIEYSSKNSTIIISTICFIIGNLMIYLKIYNLEFVYKIITSFNGTILLINLCKKIRNNNFFEYFGRKSISIYVLQGICIAMTRVIISHITYLNDFIGIIPLIVCTFFGCFIPLLIDYCCSKIWKLDFVFYPNKYIKL